MLLTARFAPGALHTLVAGLPLLLSPRLVLEPGAQARSLSLSLGLLSLSRHARGVCARAAIVECAASAPDYVPASAERERMASGEAIRSLRS